MFMSPKFTMTTHLYPEDLDVAFNLPKVNILRDVILIFFEKEELCPLLIKQNHQTK